MLPTVLLILSLLIIKYEARQEAPTNCKEQKDTWFYEEYLWVFQKSINSKINRLACCNECLKMAPSCKSWMYDEKTRDCYHSSYKYENTASVKLEGMYTGSYNKLK